MNLTFVGSASGGGGSVAVYGRQDALPSVTNYDWVHMTREDGSTHKSTNINKRSAASGTAGGIKVSKVLSRYAPMLIKAIGMCCLLKKVAQVW